MYVPLAKQSIVDILAAVRDNAKRFLVSTLYVEDPAGAALEITLTDTFLPL